MFAKFRCHFARNLLLRRDSYRGFYIERGGYEDPVASRRGRRETAEVSAPGAGGCAALPPRAAAAHLHLEGKGSDLGGLRGVGKVIVKEKTVGAKRVQALLQ